MKNLTKNIKNVKYGSYTKKGLFSISNLKCINVSYFSSISLNNKNIKKEIIITNYNGRSSEIKLNKRLYSGNIPHKILTMPALSPSMEKGVLVSWSKKVGDKVEAGDSLAKVETDKATLDFDATDEGYIAKLLVEDGTKDIPLGAPLAIIVSKQSDIKAGAELTVNTSSTQSSSSQQTTQTTSTPSPTPSTPQSKPKPSNLPPHKVLVMPSLSPSMEKGALVSWSKKVGDKIEAGDSLAKVETDKAVIDFDTTDEGYIAKLLVEDGTKDIPLGSPLAIIVSRESDIKAASEIDLNSISSSSSSSSPQQDTPQVSQTTTTTTSSSSSSSPQRSPGDRIAISPRAKVVAKEKGFKVEEIRGTGPSGRVILRDVLSHQPVVSQQPVTQQTTQQTTKQSVSQEVQYSDFKQVDINNIRRITAERLTQSKQQIPHYYLTIDCNVDKLLSLRQSLNEKLSKEQIKISLNDMIIKASALSMRKVPQVNSHWYGDHIRQYNDVHINVAVDTERGLYVPVVRNAEKIGFVEINSQVKQLADKAKNNKISLEELQGGTFTISNLGMFGVNNFSAVINPPQSAILAVGTTEKRLVLKGVDSEGRQNIVESNFLKVTLSCDHRVIDGAVGAAWLSHFRSYVEDPITMLL